MRRRPNYLAGLGSLLWLALVGLPLYVMLSASLQSRTDYAAGGPLSLPRHLTFANYAADFTGGFGRYFLNTVIVTVSVVAIVLVLVPPLSYAIVRSRNRVTTGVFRLFLLGLAIPAQAVIVPMFYVISQAGLYDNLLGVILPTAAFSLPVCALVLTGAMRDITPDLYEAMAMDGASTWRVFSSSWRVMGRLVRYARSLASSMASPPTPRGSPLEFRLARLAPLARNAGLT